MSKKTIKEIEKEVALENPIKEKPLSKAQLKKQAKEQRLAKEQHAKKQMIETRKAMAEAGEYVQRAICNTCYHCTNKETKIKMFETKTSAGIEAPYFAMKFCGLAGLSMVDVQECEMYIKSNDLVIEPIETQD